MKAIKLMPDYLTFPLWHYEQTEYGAIDPAELPLTERLQERLKLWANWYDLTLNQEYPPDSGFRSIGEVLAFDKEGVRLWGDLARELSKDGYEVVYYSLIQSRVLTELRQAKYKKIPDVQHLLATSQK